MIHLRACIVVAACLVAITGCTVGRSEVRQMDAGSGSCQDSRPVCFSRAEIAEILASQARCKADRRLCDVRIKEAIALEQADKKRAVGTVEAELQACLQTRKDTVQAMPSCMLPWVIVGVVAAFGVALAVATGVIVWRSR